MDMTINDTEVLDEHDSKAAAVIADSESSETEATDQVRVESQERADRDTLIGKRKSVSLSVRSLVAGATIVALVAAAAVLGWLYFSARQQLNADATQAANDARAEQIALDYAVNAATMDFKDLQSWRVNLVAGTSPDLNKKLSDAGTSMEQVLVPLQWSSSAQPLVAKVRSNAGGVYVVDSFVSVQTKTVQAPEALQSTATYSTTIDSNHNWQITDVGGIGSAMGPK
jgi:hypothetical protein